MKRFVLLLVVALGILASTAGPSGAFNPKSNAVFVFFEPSPPPSTLTQTAPSSQAFPDALPMSETGYGDVTAPVTPVNVTSATSGCTASDFTGFPAGTIALVERGSCFFSIKVENAEAAGAVAVIIANNDPGGTDVFEGTLTSPATVPVLMVSNVEGQSLGVPGSSAHVTVSPYPGSMDMSFFVDRGPQAITSIACALDSVPLSCGSQTSTKNTTTYTLPLTFGAGSHTFTVNVSLEDGGSVSESFPFQGAASG